MSQHDYQKYERANVKNSPNVFLMAFYSILVSGISYSRFNTKWNVLVGNKLKTASHSLAHNITFSHHL